MERFSKRFGGVGGAWGVFDSRHGLALISKLCLTLTDDTTDNKRTLYFNK